MCTPRSIVFSIAFVCFWSVSVCLVVDGQDRAAGSSDLECYGKVYKNVSLSAYYPEYDEEIDDKGTDDVRGKKLRNLQDYLDDRADWVTIAMDSTLGIPYGTPVCIPELNKRYGHRLQLQVRDSGAHLRGRKYRRADICVRSEADSYDRHVNQMVTLVF